MSYLSSNLSEMNRDVGEEPIHCNVDPPQYLSIGEGAFHSGCAVIEVRFPNMTLVNIGKISLVNNYTAHLSVKAKVSF